MRSILVEQPDSLELRQRTNGWRQLWVWLPVLVAMAVIATESTDTVFCSAHRWVAAAALRVGAGSVSGCKLGRAASPDPEDGAFLRLWDSVPDVSEGVAARAWAAGERAEDSMAATELFAGGSLYGRDCEPGRMAPEPYPQQNRNTGGRGARYLRRTLYLLFGMALFLANEKSPDGPVEGSATGSSKSSEG